MEKRKKKAFSTNGADQSGCLHGEECQVDPYLSPHTKLKSKWIKDLNIKLDTLNLIEEKWEITVNELQETIS